MDLASHPACLCPATVAHIQSIRVVYLLTYLHGYRVHLRWLRLYSRIPSPAVATFKADDKTFETSEVMDERHVTIHQGCIQVSGLAAGVYR